jgi:hypothetical protein
MSSGERAKPPATFEERNPFDISKRSGTEVAAEIAKRLAAWKQARGRSYATQSSTVPAAEGKPIGAPVQPARLPKFGEHARAHPANEPQSHAIPANAKSVNPSSAVGPTSTAPTHAAPAKPAPAKPAERPLPLAVFAAVQRAMPPAPSLKRPAASPEPTIEAPAFEAAEIAALQNASQLEMPAAELPQIEETIAVEPPSAQPSQIDVAERIASDYIDAPVEETREIEIAPPVSAEPVNEMVAASDGVAERFERRELDAHRDVAETPASDADLPAIAAVDATQADAQTDPIAAAALESGIDSARQTEPPTTEPRDIEAPWIPPSATELPETDEPAPVAQESEPARGAPLAAEAADIEPQSTDPRDIDALAMREAAFMPPAPVEPRRFDLRAIRMLDTEAPPVLRRPEIVAPSAPAVEADDIEAHRIGTGEIEAGEIGTGDGAPGIEVPRLEAPQSEIPASEAPRIIVRRPIFPHIEPAEWEVRPSSASARARRHARGGTGWAIGLGSLLLIAGVTAPAAIWQQGRTLAPPSLDQAVALNPAPTPAPQTAQPAVTAEPANPQPVAPQPAAPQPAAAQPASPPIDQAQNPPAPQPTATASTADAPQPAPQQQTSQQASLGTVANGGEVADAPISVPPPPAAIQPELAPPAPSDASAVLPETGVTPLYPPAPRPFQPQFAATPFHPTTMDGIASVATKPTVTGRLKPTQSASIAVPNAAPSAPQRLVAKPVKPVTKKRQPPLDQMFNDLIQSLSGGQPVNPANKPASPSQRR